MRKMQQHLSNAVASVCGDQLSPDARAAWLHIRDQGGWYVAADLARELLPNMPVGDGARVAGRWIAALRNRGHLARKPAGVLRGKSLFAHGVTARCLPIPGESLDPPLPIPEIKTMNTNLNEYFNEAGIKTACERLHLTPEQLHQQADLCRRLLNMATHGVPTPAAEAPVTRPLLVLNALITAYLALGSSKPELTDDAARLALAVSHELTLHHEKHLQNAAARVLAEATEQTTFTATSPAAPAAAH